ncbi:MAG TPA: single-stranded DNA-binding protein [Thermomicrobiales bacterium]|nr:single-stranded DNA-binding protein [Thermomicrobiales bacterium]
MAGVSKIILIGNLGRDPETRYTPTGRMNVQFSMAVSRRYNDSSGQQQEQTSWFRVTGWGRLAETMDKLSQSGALTKGKQVYVEGRLEAREYQDQSGQNRTSLDVTASELQLLGSRADSDMDGGDYGGSGSGSGGGRAAGDQDDQSNIDDVPF